MPRMEVRSGTPTRCVCVGVDDACYRAVVMGVTARVENRILETARHLGADVVGFAPAGDVLTGPSHSASGPVVSTSGDIPVGSLRSRLRSPADAGGMSIIVLGLSHPQDRPELDWFSPSGNTPGNSMLIRIARALSEWLQKEQIRAEPLHYYVERGGVYLKDAAVLAGLGCIGRNNLLVTPVFGPRIRLRAVLVDEELVGSGPLDFNPCASCSEVCREVCPRSAFGSDSANGALCRATGLPARDGSYIRAACMEQMNAELSADRVEDGSLFSSDMSDDRTLDLSRYTVRHCRGCERVCPGGM